MLNSYKLEIKFRSVKMNNDANVETFIVSQSNYKEIHNKYICKFTSLSLTIKYDIHINLLYQHHWKTLIEDIIPVISIAPLASLVSGVTD